MSMDEEESLIDFFKKEVFSDCVSQQLEAIRNTKYIACSLKCETVNKVLLPIFDDILVNAVSDEVLCAVAEVLPEFCVFLGDNPECYRSIINYFHDLLAHQDSIVRTQAEKSIVSFLDLVVQYEPDVRNQIVRKFSQMAITLGSEKSYPSRLSASYLTPKLYKILNSADKKSMVNLFRNLCYDEVPMVQKKASSSLVEFTELVDKSLYNSFIMPHILHFWKEEWCDDVRIGALYSCVTLLSDLSKEYNTSFSLPILLSAVQDKSWYIRLAVAEKLDKILICLNNQNIIISFHLCLLLDDREPKVLIATLTSLNRCIRSLKPDQINDVNVVGHIKRLASHPHEKVRCTLADLLLPITCFVDNPNEKEELYKNIEALLEDSSSSVKLTILCHGEEMIDLFGHNNIGSVLMDTIYALMKHNQLSIRLKMLEQFSKLATKLANNDSRLMKSLESVYLLLFQDQTFAVREMATSCIQVFSELFGSSWVTETLLTRLLNLYFDEITLTVCETSGQLAADMDLTLRPYTTQPSYLIKITVLNCIPGIVSYLKNNSEKKVCDLLQKALEDKVPNIRFSAARVIGQIIQYSLENNAYNHLLLEVENLVKRETDQDVLYYAKKTLDACEFLRSTHNSFNNSKTNLHK